jgi:hypothetical protein
MKVTHETLGVAVNEFPVAHRLTDGGVYDNLGVHHLVDGHSPPDAHEAFIVSDAEGNFDWDVTPLSSIATLTWRASSLGSNRISALQYAALTLRGNRVVSINIDGDVSSATNLRLDQQKELRRLRTDLDAFRDSEISALIEHGYTVARDTCVRENIASPGFRTTPAPSLPGLDPGVVTRKKLKNGRRLHAHLLDARDPASWGIGAVGVVIIALIAGASILAWSAIRDLSQAVSERDYWAKASSLWLDEPSDLTATALTDTDGEALFLAVQDDEPALSVVKVLQPLVAGETQPIGVLGTLWFENVVPNDLEGISYDPTDGYFVAVTSHREPTGTAQEERNRRQLLRFKIDPQRWRDVDYRIPVTDHWDLVDAGLLDLFTRHDITPNPDPAQRVGFPLEIEAVAYRAGTAQIAFKWPVPDNKALIATFDFTQKGFTNLRKVDLGGFGISALTFDAAGDLVAAANPPGRPSLLGCTDPFYGKSILYRIDPQSDRVKSRHVEGVGDKCAKAEGVALLNDLLFVSYEGERSSFRALPLPK